MKYKFKELRDDRWAIWYKEFENAGNKLGAYKIYDLYKNAKNARIGIRYKARKGQSQDESDRLILSNLISNFYKKKPIFFNCGDHSSK